MPGTYDGVGGRICSRCGRPVQRTDSGELRCTPCRTDDRARELRAQRGREDQAHVTNGHLGVLKRRAEADEDLSVDEWQTLVAADDEWSPDFGDDMAAWAAVYPPTEADYARADALWQGKAARAILKRAGVSADEFTRRASVGSRRSTYFWLNGRAPKSSSARPAATMLLLWLEADNAESDAVLRAHDLEPSLAAQRRFEKTHKVLEADDPASLCDGCARARGVLATMRASR